MADTVKRPAAIATEQLRTARAVATEWRFPPGTETGWHTHHYDYVVVPITDGDLVLETAEGPHRSHLTLGQSYTGNTGTAHNVVNSTDQEVAFIEIEVL